MLMSTKVEFNITNIRKKRTVTLAYHKALPQSNFQGFIETKLQAVVSKLLIL